MNDNHFSYRYDLPAYADGLVSGVTEVISVDRNGLPLPLVGPTCIVSVQVEDSSVLSCVHGHVSGLLIRPA